MVSYLGVSGGVAKGNLGAMFLEEFAQKRNETQNSIEWEWLTRDDLMKKYHNKSEKVDRLIAKKKRKNGLFRDHPEFEDDPEMEQYFHGIELKTRGTHAWIHTQEKQLTTF